MLEELLSKSESKTLEFKENAHTLSKIVQTVIAFANTAGGTIVIGIQDKTKNVVGIENILQDETVWLSQAQLCELFDEDKRTISEHIQNIFKEGELIEESVIRKFRTTASDGKNYQVNYYNLDVIISRSEEHTSELQSQR